MMVRIIGTRCSGKTTELIKLASENNGILVVPTLNMGQYAKDLAVEMGLSENFQIISFSQYIKQSQYIDPRLPVYIDEIEACIKNIAPHLSGYSLSVDEKEKILKHSRLKGGYTSLSIDTTKCPAMRNKIIDICYKGSVFGSFDEEKMIYHYKTWQIAVKYKAILMLNGINSKIIINNKEI